MSIKVDAANNNEVVVTPNGANFSLPNGDWYLFWTMVFDGMTTGTAEQYVCSNGGTMQVYYTGSAHATPNNIRFILDGAQDLAGAFTTLTPLNTGAWVFVLKRIGTELFGAACPVLSLAPSDSSAVQQVKLVNIYEAYPGVGPLAYGGPSNYNQDPVPAGYFCDQSLGPIGFGVGEFTTFDHAQIAFGKTPAQIGKTAKCYVRMSDVDDITDVGTDANVFTKVGALSTGTPIGFGADIPLVPPSGTVTLQPDPNGQTQRFVLSTENATSGAYLLDGVGVADIGPQAFTIASNASDFTVAQIAPGSYVPKFTLTGPGGEVTIEGAAFTIVPVSGGDGDVEPGATIPATILVSGRMVTIPAAQIGTGKKPVVYLNGRLKLRAASEGVPLVLLANGRYRLLAPGEVLGI